MPLPRDRRGRILPPPTYAETLGARPAPVIARETKAIAAMRATLTRFEKVHGPDLLISLMKTELARRGEDRAKLDTLAPKFGANGQASILDAGR